MLASKKSAKKKSVLFTEICAGIAHKKALSPYNKYMCTCSILVATNYG